MKSLINEIPFFFCDYYTVLFFPQFSFEMDRRML